MLSLKITKNTHQPYQGWRLISIAIVGLLALCTLVSLYFIYQNVFTTLNNQSAILVLKSNPTVLSIDLDNYIKTVPIMEEKNKISLIPPGLKNVFSYGSSSSSRHFYVASSTTK